MKTGQKVTAFVVALAAVFAVSVWVGNVAGNDDATVEQTAAELPGGLQSTQDGYAWSWPIRSPRRRRTCRCSSAS